MDILIKNAMLIDGTGKAAYPGSIGIRGGKLVLENLPDTAAMLPLAKYVWTNSAVFRHATQSIKSVCFSPKSRSQATVKETTGVWDWVYLSSGSRVRRPIMLM